MGSSYYCYDAMKNKIMDSRLRGNDTEVVRRLCGDVLKMCAGFAKKP